MNTPADKTVIFTFHSHPLKDAKQRWTARLTFAAGIGADAILPLTVTDGADAPIDYGVFEFAGRSIEVRDGKATISYADFIAGKHEKGLWLHRRGMPPVPGGLTFE